MTLTIATSRLIETLTDALQTADDVVGGIFLSSHRGAFGDEPGEMDLLSATSTNRYVIGHTWIPVNGSVVGMVWPVESAKTVLAICKSLALKAKEHTVDLQVVTAPPPEDPKEGEHPGWTVTLSETPALFESDTEFQFHAHHESKFPAVTIRRALSGLLTAKEVPPESPLTQWSATVLAPLVAVAKRRKTPMKFYRSELSHVQVVQIGDTWLGAAYPILPVPGESTTEPSIEPLVGEPLSPAAALLRNGSGLVTNASEAAEALRNGTGVATGYVPADGA